MKRKPDNLLITVTAYVETMAAEVVRLVGDGEPSRAQEVLDVLEELLERRDVATKVNDPEATDRLNTWVHTVLPSACMATGLTPLEGGGVRAEELMDSGYETTQ